MDEGKITYLSNKKYTLYVIYVYAPWKGITYTYVEFPVPRWEKCSNKKSVLGKVNRSNWFLNY